MKTARSEPMRQRVPVRKAVVVHKILQLRRQTRSLKVRSIPKVCEVIVPSWPRWRRRNQSARQQAGNSSPPKILRNLQHQPESFACLEASEPFYTQGIKEPDALKQSRRQPLYLFCRRILSPASPLRIAAEKLGHKSRPERNSCDQMQRRDEGVKPNTGTNFASEQATKQR